MGAGEVFKVTTIGYSEKYKNEQEYYNDDFFGKKAGLSVSGQLEGEVAATDLLVPDIGEIIGCSEREADYDKLVQAMKDRNMNMDDYADYIDLRKFGSVAHSGFGLGFERMIMYVTGMSNIRDVILYPRTVGSIR